MKHNNLKSLKRVEQAGLGGRASWPALLQTRSLAHARNYYYY